MVDLILLVFVACVFGAGFWCGKTFLTFAGMADKVKEWVKR